jgi:hypothetical protein
MIRSNVDFADPHRRSSATISRLRSCGSIERRTSRLSPRGACEAIAQRVNVDEDIGDSEAVCLLRLGRVGNAIICGLFRR